MKEFSTDPVSLTTTRNTAFLVGSYLSAGLFCQASLLFPRRAEKQKGSETLRFQNLFGCGAKLETMASGP
ncbi:MAG: hypothetical protein LUD78_12050 [Clostridiales bacterium]|nr:hypothetical protein [Clostridiales bacterium]